MVSLRGLFGLKCGFIFDPDNWSLSSHFGSDESVDSWSKDINRQELSRQEPDLCREHGAVVFDPDDYPDWEHWNPDEQGKFLEKIYGSDAKVLVRRPDGQGWNMWIGDDSEIPGSLESSPDWQLDPSGSMV